MRSRFLTTFVAAALAAVAFPHVSTAGQNGTAALASNGSASPWTPPRTVDGQPDLQGTWLSNSATPLERPKALEGRARLTDQEVAELKARAARIFDGNGRSDFAGGDDVFLAALENKEQHVNPDATGGAANMLQRVFENRTSLIVDPPDGRIPPLTPEAQQKRAAAAQSRSPAGPEDLTLFLRCITWGVPRLGANAASYSPYYQFVQTRSYVAIFSEVIHDTRIIPLDGRPHLPPTVRQWNGDPRGRWEGNTLVVDTTNFSSKSSFMGSSDRLHLVERFTRVAPDELKYAITVEDPTVWTRPWTAEVRMWLSREQMFEFACHEGNFDVVRDVLAGARADEKRADAGKSPK